MTALPDNGSLGKTNLSYVGTRSYIRGADMLSWFVDGAVRAGAPKLKRIALFRLVREIACDGEWILGEAPDPAATIDFKQEDGSIGRASFLEGDVAITRRDPDLEPSTLKVGSTSDFSGWGDIRPPRDFGELVNALVELDKKLHTATLTSRGLPSDSIRLVFMENVPVATPSMSTPFRLDVKLMGARRRDGREFTIVSIAGGPLSSAVRMCFAF